MSQQQQLQKLFASYYSGDELQQYLMVLDVVDRMAKALYPLGEEFDRWGSRLVDGRADLHPEMAAFYRQLGEAQLLGTSVPVEHGGPGMPFVLTCAVIERLAAGDCATTVGVCVHETATELIWRHGTAPTRSRFLPNMMAGEWYGGIAFTEPEAGTDLANFQTRAIRNGDVYLLDGAKRFITNAGFAHVYTLLATTDPSNRVKNSCLFAVEVGPGLSVPRLEDKTGQKASPTGDIVLDSYQVPAENLLGSEGQGYKLVLEGLASSRLLVAATAVGVAAASLDESVAYAGERRTFGKPLAQHQAIAFMLADMAATTMAARLSIWHAARLRDCGLPFAGESSAAKLLATELAARVVDRAVQIHGGMGYVKPTPVERHYRDVRVTTIYEGSSEAQRMVVSRHLSEL